MSQRLVRPSAPSAATPNPPAPTATPALPPEEPAAEPAPMSAFDALIEGARARLEAISKAPRTELAAVPLPGGGHMMVERPIGSMEPPLRLAMPSPGRR